MTDTPKTDAPETDPPETDPPDARAAAAFYARARAHADPDGRLPLPEQPWWEIFPFEPQNLRSIVLEPPRLPEPPRGGEDGQPCRACTDPERDALWSDDRWVLTSAGPLGLPFGALLQPRAHLDLGDLDDAHAAELGLLTVRVERAVRRLDGIGRVHVNRWGDGGAHLHLWFLARPAGQLQLRGSNLALWEELLPRVPAEIAAEADHRVAAALAAGGGRAHR